MAKPVTILATQLYIKVGDGASPETFSQPCLINADRALEFTANGNKIVVPDCATPDEPGWTEFVKQSLECSVSGAGVIDAVAATITTYFNWYKSKTPKNCQLWLGTIGYFSGAFHLTRYAFNGSVGNKANNELTLDSDGVIAWTSAP